MLDLAGPGAAIAGRAALSGYDVVGFDPSATRAEAARADAAIAGSADPLLAEAIVGGKLRFSSEPADLHHADVFMICSQTPHREDAPDLSALVDACAVVGAALGAGRLVVVESAPFPGVTEQVVLPALEAQGCVPGRDFLLACSPFRPEGTGRGPKVVGGLTAEATGVAFLLYQQLCEDVVAVSSSRAAELTTLLDLAFQTVNTALVNELAVACHAAGIDVWEVLGAAGASSYGFTPFQPAVHQTPLGSAGVAQLDGDGRLRLLDQALEINAAMPGYVADRIASALMDVRKMIKGAHILVLGGIAEGEGSGAGRSPTVKVMASLAARGARLSYHDPDTRSIAFDGTQLSRTELTERAVQGADLVALLGSGEAYDLGWLESHARLLFDARNVWGSDRRRRVIRL